jgi:hypothetical protein
MFSKVKLIVAHTNNLCTQHYEDIEIIQEDCKYIGDLFNRFLENIQEDSIYGFLSYDHYFSHQNVVQTIVDTINYHKIISVVYSDYILLDDKFQYHQYLPAFHPNLLSYTSQFINSPIFVTGVALKQTQSHFNNNLEYLALYAFFLNICRKVLAYHIPQALFQRIGSRNINVAQEANIIQQWQKHNIVTR